MAAWELGCCTVQGPETAGPRPEIRGWGCVGQPVEGGGAGGKRAHKLAALRRAVDGRRQVGRCRPAAGQPLAPCGSAVARRPSPVSFVLEKRLFKWHNTPLQARTGTGGKVWWGGGRGQRRASRRGLYRGGVQGASRARRKHETAVRCVKRMRGDTACRVGVRFGAPGVRAPRDLGADQT